MELIVRFCHLFVNNIYNLLQFSRVDENYSQVNLPDNDSRLLQYKTWQGAHDYVTRADAPPRSVPKLPS